MSIRIKSLIPLVVAGLAFALYLSLVWMPKSIAHNSKQYEEVVSRHLTTLAASLVPLLLENQLDNVYDNLDVLMAQNDDWRVLELRDAEGRRLYPLYGKLAAVTGDETHLFKHTIQYMDTVLGEVDLWVDFAPYLAEIRHEHDDLMLSLLLFMAGFVVIMGLVMEWFVRRPIHQLAEAATVLAQGHFDTPLPPSGSDEVGDLTRAFAEMRVAINHAQSELMSEIASHKQAQVALDRERERATVTLHSIADAVIVVDAAGQLESMNAVAERLTGWSLIAARGLPLDYVFQIMQGSSGSSADAALMQAVQQGREVPGTEAKRLRHRDGKEFFIEISAAPIRHDGRLYGAVLVFRDVTGLRQAHRDALNERDELLRIVVSSAPMMLFALDKNGEMMFAEGSELKRFSETSGRDGARSHPGGLENMPAIQRDIRRALAGEAFCSIFNLNELVYECRYTPVLNSQGGIIGAVAVALDISERKRAEERLNYLAYYDELTDLPNRALFNDRLHQAMAEADRETKNVAVIFLDLDRFKDINDTLGHEAGDHLLREVAARLVRSVRKVDTVARLGGDEFTLILPAIADSADIDKIVGKIGETFAAPFDVAERSLYVTPSMGITLYPKDARTLDSLLKNADIAMYQAKRQGRNTHQFYSLGMSANAHGRMALESNLRRALERDELTLHYQPQVDLRHGGIIGVEALLRWKHPSLGDVAPETFIPLAEETGLIESIGAWVLGEACRQCKAWQAAGAPPIKVAVNLSVRQLRDQDFPRIVLDALARSDLAPSLLEFELTESLLAHDVMSLGDSLKLLGDEGVSFAIDDFGTGYSALGYLKRYPIDTLKIDKSFMLDVHRNNDTATIANAIVALARSLQLKVVAEGVETRAQWEFLSDTSCDAVQGYLISMPLPAEAMLLLLRERRRFSPAELRWNAA